MPCTGISVVTARLAAETFGIIYESPQAIQLLVDHLKQQTGLTITATKLNGMIRFEFSTGGRVEMSGRTISDYAGGYGVPVDVDGMRDFADQLSVALQIQTMAMTINQVGYVESDSYDEVGNRTLVVYA